VNPSESKQALASLLEDVTRMETKLSNAEAIAGRRATDVGIAQKTLITIIVLSNFVLGVVVLFANVIAAH